MAFNILSAIDNELNIDNIDLTKNYVYVLELEDNRYYVGRTSNFMQRMNEHFTSKGSIYTKKYKPIKIKEIIEEKTLFDEKDKTLEYMKKFGWEKVRGYAWCREKILKEPKIKKNKEIKQNIEYVICDDDITIKNMYELENRDVIEIGNCLNKSPGSIAYSLERMGIVNRRQLSKGYFDYTFSDLYEKSKKDNILHKDQNKNLKNAISKSELTRDELKNIKTKIKSILKDF
jgi:predicted GIY-YIG superfamily endonuclease